MARLAIAIDLARCIGCDTCTVACKQENGTPVDVFFGRVLNLEAGSYPHVKRLYLPVLCNHCENPACLRACPNKAIYRREDGIVLIDQERCRGTGACVSACPYGNIVLTDSDRWYLDDAEPYEQRFVRPRLKPGVARKCTLCAHRVDEGLEPACVVACPTNARIFGDLEDPESSICKYVEQQERETGRAPLKLLPQAGTRPANLYFAPMASQQVSVGAGGAAEQVGVPAAARDPRGTREENREAAAAAPTRLRSWLASLVGLVRALLVLTLLGSLAAAAAEPPSPPPAYRSSTCAACHGPKGTGAMGPSIVGTRLPLEEFRQLVRKGRGMMPPTPASQLSEQQLTQIHGFLQGGEPEAKSASGGLSLAAALSTANVVRIFGLIGLVSLALMVRVLLQWLRCAGLGELWPAARKLGWSRAARVVLRSLLIDGLLVASLWRKSRLRWALHGLMLYGFLGLFTADLLMQAYNPSGASLPLTSPLKLLPNLAGAAMLLGVLYVHYRYRTDPYIDNGLTLGRDRFFVHLLTLTLVTGFVTEGLGYAGAAGWLMPAYVVHLGCVALLILTAPFTRFAHAFVVPMLVATTRLTEAAVAAETNPGFAAEPSPGRHHKSLRLARDLLSQINPGLAAQTRIRYYP